MVRVPSIYIADTPIRISTVGSRAREELIEWRRNAFLPVGHRASTFADKQRV